MLIPIVLVLFVGNLISQINHQQSKADSWQKIVDVFTNGVNWQIVVVVALMFVNWAIEALKWKNLIKPLQSLTYLQAYKAVLAGTSFAANTPNRVGEYVGRMVYIQEGKRLQSIPLTVTGSFSQLLITLIAGCIGLAFYIPIVANMLQPPINTFWLKTLLIGSLFVTIIALLIYFKISWLVSGFARIPILHKYSYLVTKVEAISTKVLLQSLLLSLLRYSVFIAQYIITMQAFGLQLSVATYCILLPVMLLVLNLVPSFVIVEAGVRSTVGVQVFSVAVTNSVAVIASNLFILFINLMLPAVLGLLLLVGKRILKK